MEGGQEGREGRGREEVGVGVAGEGEGPSWVGEEGARESADGQGEDEAEELPCAAEGPEEVWVGGFGGGDEVAGGG